jgi:RNA polymerase sigma factor (sigma-70 family)
VIDPGEKTRLFEETIDRHTGWIGIIARNNAPTNSCEDLEQDIRMAFWKSMDRYDGKSSGLDTWFFSVAQNTIKRFRRTYQNIRKREEAVLPNPLFVEQEWDQIDLVEEYTGKLADFDRQVLTLYIDHSYAEMSAVLGVNEASLRKRVSRIKEQIKTKYQDYKNGTR